MLSRKCTFKGMGYIHSHKIYVADQIFDKNDVLSAHYSTANTSKQKRDQYFGLFWKTMASGAVKPRYIGYSIVNLCSNTSYYWGFAGNR